ncbi:MAG: hypothetical protein K8L99_36290 [Anaerolineae bacterium]|nr:hypothetical protein [Anaerolineae bacterium]
MQRVSLISLALFCILLSACQGPPPTQIVIVVTATPTNDDGNTSNNAQEADTPQSAETTVEPTATATVEPSPTTDPNQPTVIPTATPTINQIQVAEQVFEHGRAFWIQPTDQIWVMVVTGEGQGQWTVYENTFKDGDPELDESLTPPEGKIQPERGFGKLWRENIDVRDSLGWAVTPEFGYVTRYEYHPGDPTVNGDTVTYGPGYHVLTSLYEEAFRFNEADGTWQLN